jgi:hypothetical protein
MITPMRRFNMNVSEVFLSDVGNLFAAALLVCAVAIVVIPGWFGAGSFWGGLLAFATFTSGLMLGLGSGGVRQNRATLDIGMNLTLLTGIGWLAYSVIEPAWKMAILGIVMVLMFLECWIVRREGIRARFTPRFFSLRQFETMIQIADAMLDADDRKIHPIEVAIRTDHLLDEIDSPVKKNIRYMMFLIEWLTPFLVLRPFPFSDLGTHERRAIIRKVIWSRGLFRDVSKSLKVLSTLTYYTHPEVRESVGYVDFDERERVQNLDQAPQVFPAEEGELHETL